MANKNRSAELLNDALKFRRKSLESGFDFERVQRRKRSSHRFRD